MMLFDVCCRSRELYRPVEQPYQPEATPVAQHKPRAQPNPSEPTPRGQRVSPDRRSSSPDSSHGILQPDSLPAGQVPMQLALPISAPASAEYPPQVQSAMHSAHHLGRGFQSCSKFAFCNFCGVTSACLTGCFTRRANASFIQSAEHAFLVM